MYSYKYLINIALFLGLGFFATILVAQEKVKTIQTVKPKAAKSTKPLAAPFIPGGGVLSSSVDGMSKPDKKKKKTRGKERKGVGDK